MNRCPVCGKGAVFHSLVITYERCPNCGHRFEKEPGFFLGASVAAYFLGAFSLVPTLLICLFAFQMELTSVLLIGIGQLLILTPLIWRFSRLIWIYAEFRMSNLLK